MEAGFIMTPSGEIIPLEKLDFPIWQHGEGGNAPQDYGFTITAGKSGKLYDVQINTIEDDLFETELRFGWEWESRVIERYSKCTMNGVKGWGVTEWAYRNFSGRPEECAAADPPRVALINKG
ncbi:unnamed protein product [Notodromas monacha]|uniref:Uncharacterized protein n=1 Tax=Notodromas monacha TaxID=399045 RepID=A0A7R9G8L1_9CRUS|nr:unnamed protein product [Notodromas monacha]CAG0913305.1 unnamed protein product [Notodromas monacha]